MKRLARCKSCLDLPLPLSTKIYIMYVTDWAEKVYRKARKKYLKL